MSYMTAKSNRANQAFGRVCIVQNDAFAVHYADVPRHSDEEVVGSTASQVKNSNIFNNFRAMRWCTCLRHCATSRTTATSIPDGVTGTFHLLNPSGRTMAEKPSQPLTKTCTTDISWGVKAGGA
jgi:hypothetical protein